MRIIAESRLKRLAESHGDCTEQVAVWVRTVRAARWRNLAEVRMTYPHADAVNTFTVFNIKGNDYRLIAGIDYHGGRIYIKFLLTHGEYDKGRWKNIE
ncbi:MAG TPA: type II toxin-antitoxin system HigB family toxin [Chloroflexota bacterium]